MLPALKGEKRRTAWYEEQERKRLAYTLTPPFQSSSEIMPGTRSIFEGRAVVVRYRRVGDLSASTTSIS